MNIKAISETIQNLYQSVPGETAYNKTAFLGQKALETLPFVAVGYYLRGRVSSEKLIFCMEMLPSLEAKLPSPFLSKIVPSFGIGVEIERGLIAAKMARNASSPISRFALFCTASAGAHYAASYFRSLYGTPTPTNSSATVYSPMVDLALKCMALPIQFKYRPYETIASLCAGAFFAKNNLSRLCQELKKGQTEVIQNIYTELSTACNEFSELPSKTTLLPKIWNECSRMILSVSSTKEALMSGLYQGKELAHAFMKK